MNYPTHTPGSILKIWSSLSCAIQSFFFDHYQFFKGEGESDAKKLFSLRVHLEDDSVSIYDHSKEYNYGTDSKVFLKRIQVPKVGQFTASGQPQFYTLQDFIPGNVIKAFNRNFVIEQASEKFVDELKQRGELSDEEIATIQAKVTETAGKAPEKESVEQPHEVNIRLEKQVEDFVGKLRELTAGDDEKLGEIIRLLTKSDEEQLSRQDVTILARGFNIKPEIDFENAFFKYCHESGEYMTKETLKKALGD